MVSEDQIRKIAASVTEKVWPGSQSKDSADSTDLRAVSQQLREIQNAVGQLERKIQNLAQHQSSHSLPVIGGSQPVHPSQELFDIPEEVTEFVDYLETKQCVLDPGKPCIGRGECRSRGF